jgi:putative ABC transport system ATP-binding protein
VTKTYRADHVEVAAIRDISLAVRPGEFTAIVGPSGSGKTTLLNLIGGLDRPTSGRVLLAGRPVSEMKGRELSDFRRDHIGFVFQSFNLVPVLTVQENIEYVMLLQAVPARERRTRVADILDQLGLGGMEQRRPPQLSGGEQQRVAVARALVARPDVVLADEPTANLDSATGSALLDLMRRLNETRGTTFLFSTHDERIMARARRLVVLRDGAVVEDAAR